MSDIDFEELDKAVNNLVGKKDVGVIQDTSVVPNNPEANPETPAETPAPQPHISQKPKGRFMDVLHPSSDMTGKNTPLPPRKVVSPLNNPALPPTEDAPPSVSPPPVQNDNETAFKSDWPDPIEASQQTEAEKPAPAPLFLPDTKVEKRPLGGFGADAMQGVEPEPGPETTPEAPTEPVSLPPELEADLVAIEEGSSFSEIEAAEAKEKNDEEPVTPHREDAAKPEVVLRAPPPEKKPEEKLSGLLAAGSIPQQYRPTVAPEDPIPNHPIFFDADHYDSSLVQNTHAKKPGSTSVFQWIFIIVGLLLLGATLGAALFVFVSSS